VHARGALLTVLLLAWSAGAACGSTGSDAPAGPSPTALMRDELPFRASMPFLRSLPVGYRLETLLDGLDMPASIAALPDGRLLIAEQERGRVRVVRDGRLEAEPWFEQTVRPAEDVFVGELGLVSVAADPLFAENRYVYLYYTVDDDRGARTVLARLRDADGRGTELTELLSVDLAPESRHIAGGIAFDRAGAILVGVGDHEQQELAPRLDAVAGKVLRIDRDGNPPPGNPFAGRDDADPRVYAYGLRNPFGVAVDPVSGRAFIAENRNVAGDAVYELEAGADYGWPEHDVALREPLVFYDRPMGAAGIVVYRGGALPAFDGDLFFCTFHGGGALHWSEPDEVAGFDLAMRDRVIAGDCSSGVTVGADGFLYFLSHGEGRLMRISRLMRNGR
jgi:glucose/arabinose dehydrogenase